jgi:3-methyladenine DNA glycosylase/8-oxoguanine DNA glycosylase
VGVTGRTLSTPEPLDVALTFGPLVRGRHDPASRILGDEWTHAMNSPAGPVTLRVRADRRAGAVDISAWGPGDAWVMEHAPDIVGIRDAGCEFAPTNPIVAALHRRLRGLRMIRLGAVFDLAVATTIEQRVTTIEARRSWRALVRRHGEAAPGRHGLVVPPSARVLAALPDWEWRRMGVEGRRASTMQRLACEASALERCAAAGDEIIERRLRSVRGVGPWTAAHVMHLASGDADAVPIGDWHLPGHVGHALVGEARADDDRMLELLEPFRPHRGRVWRLIVSGTGSPPRRAPRARIHDLMRAEANRGRRR